MNRGVHLRRLAVIVALFTLFGRDRSADGQGWAPTNRPSNVTAAAVAAAGAATAAGFYGDGSDGTATADGTAAVTCTSTTGSSPNKVYTQTRDCYFANLTVNVSKTWLGGSFRLFVNGALTVNGSVNVDGSPGSVNNGAQGGALQGASVTLGTGGGGGNVPQSSTNALGGGGGADSNSDSPGTVTAPLAAVGGTPRNIIQALINRSFAGGGASTQAVINGGAGGAGASADAYGGGGGGVLMVIANTIAGTGTISANGGAGENGAFVSGGGGGGYVVVISHSSTITPTANAGASGGRTAAAGQAGTVLQFTF